MPHHWYQVPVYTSHFAQNNLLQKAGFQRYHMGPNFPNICHQVESMEDSHHMKLLRLDFQLKSRSCHPSQNKWVLTHLYQLPGYIPPHDHSHLL